MKRFWIIAWILTSAACAVAETPEVSADITRTVAGETTLHLSFLTTASSDKLWKALTTQEELVKWAAPAVRVEMKAGGVYEYYFNPKRPTGKRGMEGSRVLSFVPGKMLSHSGALPDTWVVWSIEPAGDQQVLNYYSVGTSTDWSDSAEARLASVMELVEKLAKYVQP